MKHHVKIYLLKNEFKESKQNSLLNEEFDMNWYSKIFDDIVDLKDFKIFNEDFPDDIKIQYFCSMKTKEFLEKNCMKNEKMGIKYSVYFREDIHTFDIIVIDNKLYLLGTNKVINY